jgi:hypothetical protein
VTFQTSPTLTVRHVLSTIRHRANETSFIDKAFRHGDIENILTNIAKTAGGLVTGGGILQFAQSVVAAGSGGSKFSKNDVKKVYFASHFPAASRCRR